MKDKDSNKNKQSKINKTIKNKTDGTDDRVYVDEGGKQNVWWASIPQKTKANTSGFRSPNNPTGTLTHRRG